MKKLMIAMLVIAILLAIPIYAENLVQVCSPDNNCWKVQDVEEHNGVSVYWSEVYGDVEHQKYYVAVQNNNNIDKSFNPKALIDTSSIDLSQIKNLQISEITPIQKEIANIIVNCINNTQVIETKENGTQTIQVKECSNIVNAINVTGYEWSDISTSPQYQTAKAEANSKTMSIQKYDNEDSLTHLKIEYDIPYSRDGEKYGRFDARVAIQDTITNDEFHPFVNTSFNRCITINLSNVYILPNSTHEIILNSTNFNNYAEADANGLDLRFYEGNCQNQTEGRLSHWIQDWKQTAVLNSTIWVMTRTENLSQMSMLWNFTGGIPDNVSNGRTTFPLFEDCQTGNGINDWTTTGGSFTCSGGAFTTTGGTWNGARRSINYTQPFLEKDAFFQSLGKGISDQINFGMANAAGSTGDDPAHAGYNNQRNVNSNRVLMAKSGQDSSLCNIGAAVAEYQWIRTAFVNSTTLVQKILTGTPGDIGLSCEGNNNTYANYNISYAEVHSYDSGNILNYMLIGRMKYPYPVYTFGATESSVNLATESEARQAIHDAIILELPSGLRINDTKISARYANGTQKRDRFDVFVKYLNQRWAFNYITGNDPSTNLTAMGITLNVLDVTLANTTQITAQVRNYINSTKQEV